MPDPGLHYGSVSPVTPANGRSPSEPSFVSETTITPQGGRSPIEPSRTTGTTGPSKTEPALITSTWGIGWQTPALMLPFYTLAVAIAVGHLILFRYIDGREADGPSRVTPQSYVTTASNILSNVFGIALRGALGVAFVQYLWYLLREYAMKVSTIDLLFSIRSNPFQICRFAVVGATPTLCVLAIIIWATNIISGFPPGAITIATVQVASYQNIAIPTYNASFMGNGSGVEAEQFSLANLYPAQAGVSGFTADEIQVTKDDNLLPRIAFPVLVKGEAFSQASPCGPNCSYSVEFEGPYLQCVSSSTTYAQNYSEYYTIYNGSFVDIRNAFADSSLYNGSYSNASYTSSTLTPLQINNTDMSLIVREDNIFCLPARAKNTVTNTYTNNVQSRTISTEVIDRLVNLVPLTHNSMIIVPGFEASKGYGLGTEPANWSENALAIYRDLNHISIIDAMMFYLDGTILASSTNPDINTVTYGSTLNPQLSQIPNNSISSNVAWGQRVSSDVTGACLGVNGSMIDTTRFNMNFGNFAPSQPGGLNISVTQDMLNDYLLNVTLSMMGSFQVWNTTANATITRPINVYSFSQPLNLIIPYFVSLLIAIPFIMLGGVALMKNGVSAMDGGFIQIITTSTGSAILDRAAAGGCLGGNESIPQELNDLKIKFGEFIGRDDQGLVKRAGFGVESELTSLKKGSNYGIARWI